MVFPYALLLQMSQCAVKMIVEDSGKVGNAKMWWKWSNDVTKCSMCARFTCTLHFVLTQDQRKPINYSKYKFI